jgi:nucleoside-diphosphate-sugar epimerase
VTPYAISKAAGEHYCKFYNARVVRLCNIHGDGGHGVIDRFREQETLEIAGDGSQTRTYAPVEKAVAALIEAAEGRGGSLTILPGRDMSVNDVANRYFREKPRRYVPRLDTDIEDGRQLCR